ncbi:hypothetical protein FBEOM_12985 [Fusarium beomiforme]|uniref:Uncharacterized protein n=1 Tax=Fusarium beomiforme TaxID=44412 RepID=A0A9P5A748_9HYPO|nr:hypothetical protein FBEOM_12985 [Fusarium beomiforme]
MSASLEQRVSLLARQIQRFYERFAGSGRPNSRIITDTDVKLAAALEPVYDLYESGDIKATNEGWPFYWQLHLKAKCLRRDLGWFRCMGPKLLHNGKITEADLLWNYEEDPKHNWDDLYGPPAVPLTDAEKQTMWAETSTSETWPRQNEKPTPYLTASEQTARDAREYLSEVKKVAEPFGDGDLISMATTPIPVNTALCNFEPMYLE